MSLVVDIVTWAAYEARLRAYLGGVEGQDEDLEDLLAVATGAADHWMGNSFEDDDGENTLVGNILRRVVKGVLDFAHSVYNNTGEQGPLPGLSSSKTADLSEGYAVSKVTRVPADELALSQAKSSWTPFRENVWR